MIGHATGLDGWRFQMFQNSNDVPVETRTDVGADHWLAVFGAEDEMHEDSGEGLGHVRSSVHHCDGSFCWRQQNDRARGGVSPRWGWGNSFGYVSQGAALGYGVDAPLARWNPRTKSAKPLSLGQRPGSDGHHPGAGTLHGLSPEGA